MRTHGTFAVASFEASTLTPPPLDITVGAPVGVAVMEKVYAGGVEGHSATIFTSAFDMATGVGTYVALESFEGRLDDRTGGFAFVHSATTTGADRAREMFVIVPGTGVGELVGITGGGGMDTNADPHPVWFDYELG
ncbi:MAG: DUF3224 domain-containing protein [Lapillicoccus sp.]